jgi:hypothetical protein
MAIEISGAAVEKFSKKLEEFSATLSDEERTLLKGAMERGTGLSSQDLAQVRGGVSHSLTFSAVAPALNASFFTGLMCG